ASVASEQDVDVLAGLAALIDSSLVETVPTPAGEPRFRMVETIREFAFEQLSSRGEVDEAQLGLIRHLIRMCESEGGNRRGPELAAWFASLDLELDNVRAALTWTLESGDHVDLGLHLAALLHSFWKEGAHWSEGRRWLERTLAEAREVDPV